MQCKANYLKISDIFVTVIGSACFNELNNDIIAHFNGDSYNPATNQWQDVRTSKVVLSTGTEGIGYFDGSDINDEKYLNGKPIIFGSTATKILFDEEVPPDHTIFAITKYKSESIWKRRILNAESYNNPIGHWGGSSGIAWYWDRWITTPVQDNFASNWVLSSSSPGRYRGNGKDFTTVGWTSIPWTINTKYGINRGVYGGETSDFAIVCDTHHIFF